MTADSQGNDLDAVGIPITGLAAWAPLASGNVIAKADLGASPLTLPAAFQRLGLIKQDGGPAPSIDGGDMTEFFQRGYKIAGDVMRSFTIGLAEDNAAVRELIYGLTPDSNGVIEVPSQLNDAVNILVLVTRYRNGKEKRQQGAAQITAVELDQQERGSVEGAGVTFTWIENDLFNGAPYWEWGPAVPVAE